MQKVKISKSTLKELYLDQHLTTYEIAKKLGCCQATVWKRLHLFGIQPRKAITRRSKTPSKGFLNEYYVKRKFSTWKIEREFGYSRGTIHRKLKEFGINTRTLAQANIKKQRKPFKGSL